MFSTSVGVCFAYPILSQIVDIKNEKTIKECDRVMRVAEKFYGKNGLSHLGAEKNEYQFKLHKLSGLNTLLTFLSTLIGFAAFSLLVVSSIKPSIHVDHTISSLICVILCLPFALGLFQLFRWHDAYSKLQGAISYYRGDRNWSGKMPSII